MFYGLEQMEQVLNATSEVTIAEGAEVDAESLAVLLENAPNLESIKLPPASVTDEMKTELACLQEMYPKLKFPGIEISEEHREKAKIEMEQEDIPSTLTGPSDVNEIDIEAKGQSK